MKFGFVTCVQLGLSCMKSVYEMGEKLDLAITLPDHINQNKSGRVYIDDFCDGHKIPLFKSTSINNLDVIKTICRAEIDWLFIIGWSQIAKQNLLDSPKKGVLGIHPTLLPEGRGRASIPWAILKELNKTGVTMFKVDNGIDTGPIAGQIKILLRNDETATELYKKVVDAHSQLIKKTIKSIIDGSLNLIAQDNNKATIWSARKPQDGEINLTGSVFEAEKLIRATSHPYPGAFYFINDLKIIIWKAKIVTDKNFDLNNNNFIKFKDGILLVLDYSTIKS